MNTVPARYRRARLICFALLVLTPVFSRLAQARSSRRTNVQALPYQLTFEPVTYPTPLPAVQSYTLALAHSGEWLVLGGREQGLHGFSARASSGDPANFDNFNHFMYVIDPRTGGVAAFDLNRLSADRRDPLVSTNQESYYDPQTDLLYIVGGYGKDTRRGSMVTFDTITAFPVSAMITALKARPQDPARIAGLLKQSHDPRFAVTGGGLYRLGSVFYLVFGQWIMGEYTFGHVPELYQQKYREEVRAFTLDAGLKIRADGVVTSQLPSHPYHRRDLNVLADIDPATDQERIAAFGGVFPPGRLAADTHPIYVDRTNTVSEEPTFEQSTCLYSCAVIPVYSKRSATMSRTFFGGITRSPNTRGINPGDGLPWTKDIVRIDYSPRRNPAYTEQVMGQTPGKTYIGTDAMFVPSIELMSNGRIRPNGIVNLDSIPAGAGQTLIGYIYGGIESSGPQQEKNGDFQGTRATNMVLKVQLTHPAS